jgi:hypothetical protein
MSLSSEYKCRSRGDDGDDDGGGDDASNAVGQRGNSGGEGDEANSRQGQAQTRASEEGRTESEAVVETVAVEVIHACSHERLFWQRPQPFLPKSCGGHRPSAPVHPWSHSAGPSDSKWLKLMWRRVLGHHLPGQSGE